jgi:hypothetical protein
VKTLTLVACTAAFVLAGPVLTFAQENSSAGTAPENRGATGWTGGSRDQTKGGKDVAAADAKVAPDSPWYAEGLDLKGPPRQFPESKTPE